LRPLFSPLQSIFGDLKSDFISEKSTCVWFNDKKPTFMDEIKILLPPQITPKHHVLITYYNVQAKSSGKKSDTHPVLKTPVAYSFLPLFTDRYVDLFFLGPPPFSAFPLLPSTFLSFLFSLAFPPFGNTF
jgi:hypothetical protein